MSVTANIHANAKIGKGTVIEPFATVGDNVIIGQDCWIGPNAVIMPGSRIGNNVRIFPGAVIGGVPQDLKYEGEETLVEIGDNTTIREYVTINRGTADRLTTKVGKDCLLMAYVHVAHDCLIGDNCVIANAVNIAGHVQLGDYVILEGTVAIQQFVQIGAHAFVAGGSLVRKNVPPFIKAAREPLSYAGVNSIGLKRRGFSDQIILQIEDLYRVIYVHNTNITKAIKVAELEIPESKEKKEILEFIRSSDKGIIRGIG